MDKQKVLLQIENTVRSCTKCRLCKTAVNGVPGEGNINAKIIFIGEAPGATEDKLGRPFVGRAGKLLDNFLAEIGLNRSEVWIGNIIKHRPPENRDPLPDEILACQPYLKMQIEAISPLLIVTLGRFSMNYFYPDGRITRDHGELRVVNGKAIFPLYHPAAALRNGDFFKALRNDFLKIPKVLKDLEESKTKSNQKEIKSDGLQIDLGL